LKEHIREIPDFPTPGILFRDITPLLGHPEAFRRAVELLAERFEPESFDSVVAIESRGFVFAAPLAYRLGIPLVPVRKEGKLPFDTHSVTYALEYGSDALEIHVDAIGEGSRVLIVDDLLATGGTAAATVRLIERSGASVAGLAFVIELTDLRGRDALAGYRVESLVTW
jgi:adenine phosphoribosyltransferase